MLRTAITENLNSDLLRQKYELINQLKLYHEKSESTKSEETKIVINTLVDTNLAYEEYSDTILLNKQENKYVLYRRLKYTMPVGNKNYEVQILKSQSFTDDLIVKMVLIICILFTAFLISLYILNKHTLQGAWSGFYDTISNIKNKCKLFFSVVS